MYKYISDCCPEDLTLGYHKKLNLDCFRPLAEVKKISFLQAIKVQCNRKIKNQESNKQIKHSNQDMGIKCGIC